MNTNLKEKEKKHRYTLLLLEEEEDDEEAETEAEAKKAENKNKGSGAGGANTNFHGKKFEEKTNNTSRLLADGYQSHSYYLSKQFDDKTVVFVTQHGFKTYMKQKYDIGVFRCPDEAYIIEYKDTTRKTTVKILEKKEQRVEGSVETKLWSGPSLKREYELLLGEDCFEVSYGFCVNDFLRKKITSHTDKFIILNIIFAENNINVLFGDDEDYFDSLDKWWAQ